MELRVLIMGSYKKYPPVTVLAEELGAPIQRPRDRVHLRAWQGHPKRRGSTARADGWRPRAAPGGPHRAARDARQRRR